MDGIVETTSPEQAADLAALQAHIAPGAEEQNLIEPVGPDFGTEASQMTDLVAAMITGYEPKTLHIWDEPRKAQIAASLAPVLEKYNFTLGNIPPEFYLLMLVGPPLYQSSKIIADGMNRREVQAAPPPPVMQSNGAPNGATHSPEMMSL
jgi:hypothetical protein